MILLEVDPIMVIFLKKWETDHERAKSWIKVSIQLVHTNISWHASQHYIGPTENVISLIKQDVSGMVADTEDTWTSVVYESLLSPIFNFTLFSPNILTHSFFAPLILEA